jgi:hypothetical protein
MFPIIISICFFWAIFLSSDNERTAVLLFTTCSLAVAILTVFSQWYIKRKLKEIDSHTAVITQVSGHPFITTSFMSDPDGPLTSSEKYWIDKQEIYLPYQWRSIGLGSSDATVTAEVYIAPWGKAYPVSIDKKFQLEKEVGCESIKIKPVNLLRNILVVVSLFCTITGMFLPPGARKTTWLAPVEAFYILSTHKQQKTFNSVHQALSYPLKPFQPITIENAVLLPRPVEGFQKREMIVADPPEDLDSRVTALKKILFREAQSLNPFFTHFTQLNPSTKPGLDDTNTVSTDMIQKLSMKLDLLFSKEHSSIQEGFITDDDMSYPTKWLYLDEFHPPSIEAYPDVISYLDTMTRYHTIKGILIPRPTVATDTARFSYFIDRSRENYPFFSPLFLTIIFVVLLLMVVADIVQAIRNSAISRRVRQLYESEI